MNPAIQSQCWRFKGDYMYYQFFRIWRSAYVNQVVNEDCQIPDVILFSAARSLPCLEGIGSKRPVAGPRCSRGAGGTQKGAGSRETRPDGVEWPLACSIQTELADFAAN